MVQISQKFLHLNLPIGEVPKESYLSGLSNTLAGSNLVNLEYHQSVTDKYPNLVLKFVYLKDMDDMDLFTKWIRPSKK